MVCFNQERVVGLKEMKSRDRDPLRSLVPSKLYLRDKSLKGDRSLCPVRALCYYLDRTSDLRKNKEVDFVSFEKGWMRTSHLTLSPHGSSRLWSYAMGSLTRRPWHYIRLKSIMSGPVLLLRPMTSYKLVSYCKPLGPIISQLSALVSLAIVVWTWWFLAQDFL